MVQIVETASPTGSARITWAPLARRGGIDDGETEDEVELRERAFVGLSVHRAIRSACSSSAIGSVEAFAFDGLINTLLAANAGGSALDIVYDDAGATE